MVDHRVTFSRRHPYATKSNRSYKVKTPGGKLTIHRLKKKSTGPKCGDCKCRLPGIKNMKSFEYKNCKKREKTVSRVYGGSRCGQVRTRARFSLPSPSRSGRAARARAVARARPVRRGGSCRPGERPDGR